MAPLNSNSNKEGAKLLDSAASGYGSTAAVAAVGCHVKDCLNDPSTLGALLAAVGSLISTDTDRTGVMACCACGTCGTCGHEASGLRPRPAAGRGRPRPSPAGPPAGPRRARDRRLVRPDVQEHLLRVGGPAGGGDPRAP